MNNENTAERTPTLKDYVEIILIGITFIGGIFTAILYL